MMAFRSKSWSNQSAIGTSAGSRDAAGSGEKDMVRPYCGTHLGTAPYSLPPQLGMTEL